VKQTIKEEAENAKKQVKDYTKSLVKEYSADAIKKQLIAFLESQSFLLQSAFHVMVIRDIVFDIKRICKKYGSSSIDQMTEAIELINDVIKLFEEIGITEDAVGLSLDDLARLGLAIVDKARDVVDETVDDVTNAAKSTYDTATGAVNNVTA